MLVLMIELLLFLALSLMLASSYEVRYNTRSNSRVQRPVVIALRLLDPHQECSFLYKSIDSFNKSNNPQEYLQELDASETLQPIMELTSNMLEPVHHQYFVSSAYEPDPIPTIYKLIVQSTKLPMCIIHYETHLGDDENEIVSTAPASSSININKNKNGMLLINLYGHITKDFSSTLEPSISCTLATTMVKLVCTRNKKPFLVDVAGTQFTFFEIILLALLKQAKPELIFRLDSFNIGFWQFYMEHILAYPDESVYGEEMMEFLQTSIIIKDSPALMENFPGMAKFQSVNITQMDIIVGKITSEWNARVTHTPGNPLDELRECVVVYVSDNVDGTDTSLFTMSQLPSIMFDDFYLASRHPKALNIASDLTAPFEVDLWQTFLGSLALLSLVVVLAFQLFHLHCPRRLGQKTDNVKIVLRMTAGVFEPGETLWFKGFSSGGIILASWVELAIYINIYYNMNFRSFLIAQRFEKAHDTFFEFDMERYKLRMAAEAFHGLSVLDGNYYAYIQSRPNYFYWTVPPDREAPFGWEDIMNTIEYDLVPDNGAMIMTRSFYGNFAKIYHQNQKGKTERTYFPLRLSKTKAIITHNRISLMSKKSPLFEIFSRKILSFIAIGITYRMRQDQMSSYDTYALPNYNPNKRRDAKDGGYASVRVEFRHLRQMIVSYWLSLPVLIAGIILELMRFSFTNTRCLKKALPETVQKSLERTATHWKAGLRAWLMFAGAFLTLTLVPQHHSSHKEENDMVVGALHHLHVVENGFYILGSTMTHALHAIGFSPSRKTWKNCGREFLDVHNLKASFIYEEFNPNETTFTVMYVKKRGVVTCSWNRGDCLILPERREGVYHFRSHTIKNERFASVKFATWGDDRLLLSPISRNQLWILDIALEKVYPLLDKTVPKFGKAHCLLALKNSVIMLGRLDLGYYTYQNSAWHKMASNPCNYIQLADSKVVDQCVEGTEVNTVIVLSLVPGMASCTAILNIQDMTWTLGNNQILPTNGKLFRDEAGLKVFYASKTDFCLSSVYEMSSYGKWKLTKATIPFEADYESILFSLPPQYCQSKKKNAKVGNFRAATFDDSVNRCPEYKK